MCLLIKESVRCSYLFIGGLVCVDKRRLDSKHKLYVCVCVCLCVMAVGLSVCLLTLCWFCLLTAAD